MFYFFQNWRWILRKAYVILKWSMFCLIFKVNFTKTKTNTHGFYFRIWKYRFCTLIQHTSDTWSLLASRDNEAQRLNGFGGIYTPLFPCIVVINIIERFHIDNNVWVMAFRKKYFNYEKIAQIKIKCLKNLKIKG